MTSPTPQSPRPNSLIQSLAEAYLQRGQFAEAAERFGELLRNGLQTPNVYRNLALALLGMENVTPTAQQIYEHVLKNFPGDRELYLRLTAVLLNKKAKDGFALKCYQQTLNLNPAPGREVQWALALHLQESGYEPAAFEILKRMALRENGNEPQTLAQFMQLAARLDKQTEARSTLLYLEGRNERAHGVARILGLDHARTYLREHEASSLSTREWQTITRAALGYERLENLSAAREFTLLRLALARLHGRNAQRLSSIPAQTGATHLHEFISRLTPAETSSANATFALVFGMKLANLGEVREQVGEEIARNLARKFLAFAAKHLGVAAQAKCYFFSDGLLASVSSLAELATAAVELLHKIERYNLTAAKGAQLFAHAVVHAADANAFDAGQEQLQTLYATLHLLEAQSLDGQTTAAARNRLWFPREVYEREFYEQDVPVRACEQVCFAAEEFYAEVCEAVWRNPLAYVEEKAPYDLGRFTVQAKLRETRGAGTYRGRDRQLERNVVIKALGADRSAKLAADQAERERVLAAIRSVAKLEAPGLATIYDMGFHDGIFFYAREYLEGQTLAQARQGGRSFSFGESVKLGLRLCRILSLAHRQGAAHGNLKPENIWLVANEELKLTDFYAPGFVEPPESAMHMQTTSWYYAAPEHASEFAPNAESDIYALGLLLFELMSGLAPLAALDSVDAWQEYELPPLAAFWPEAPPGISELLSRACAKLPEQRFANLFALENELRIFAQ